MIRKGPCRIDNFNWWLDFLRYREANMSVWWRGSARGDGPGARTPRAPKRWSVEESAVEERGNFLQSEPRVARRAAGCRNIALERVVHHHAIRVKAPAERPDGPLHALDPATRQAVAIALIVQRNHFFTKNSHQVFAVAGVVNIHLGMS